jgi:hypothetical protein
MPPPTPTPSYQKKTVKKVKILQLKRTKQKSLLEEHFYGILVALLCLLTVFLMGLGMEFYESTVVALWIVGIIFFARQVVRFLKGEQAPKKEVKPKAAAANPEKYTPPALPRVSKNFSPMPPAGDKRYPPPSPFIKPPK